MKEKITIQQQDIRFQGGVDHNLNLKETVVDKLGKRKLKEILAINNEIATALLRRVLMVKERNEDVDAFLDLSRDFADALYRRVFGESYMIQGTTDIALKGATALLLLEGTEKKGEYKQSAEEMICTLTTDFKNH